VCGSVLQCLADRRRRCVAVSCRLLLCLGGGVVDLYEGKLNRIPVNVKVCCSVLQCVASYCRVLQCSVAGCCSVLLDLYENKLDSCKVKA